MNWLDRAVGYVAPRAGLRRVRNRYAMAALRRSYEGARLGRRTEGWIAAGTGANAESGESRIQGAGSAPNGKSILCPCEPCKLLFERLGFSLQIHAVVAEQGTRLQYPGYGFNLPLVYVMDARKL